jgi:restriction endonuclease S subunit
VKYLFQVLNITLKEDMQLQKLGNTMPYIKLGMLQTFKIPLPPLEIQEQIVAELDGYAGIIAGAKQVVQSWKPKIEIDPSWEKAKLGEVFDMQNGRAFKKEEWSTVGLPIIRIANLNSESAEYNYFKGDYDKRIEVNNDDLLFSWSGTVGTSFGPCYWIRGRGLLNQHIYKFEAKQKNIDKKFAFYVLELATPEIETKAHGAGGLVHITKAELSQFEIPLPPLDIQKQIVEKIEMERTLVVSAKKLVEIYEEKTKGVVKKLWEE